MNGKKERIASFTEGRTIAHTEITEGIGTYFIHLKFVDGGELEIVARSDSGQPRVDMYAYTGHGHQAGKAISRGADNIGIAR